MEALLLPSPPSPNKQFVGFEEDRKESSLLWGICMSALILQMYLFIYIL